MEEQGGRRRSKRKLKSVAELERRARELFEQEGEQLYDGSDDESVDIGQLSEEEVSARGFFFASGDGRKQVSFGCDTDVECVLCTDGGRMW